MDTQPTTTSPSPLPADLRRLVLTGFMGAGKSTVGRLLATRLGWDFLDLDTFIESRTGLTIPNIFAIHGEPHFRQLESEALACALLRDNLVLALGGGAPETPANRLLLKQTLATATIFLDAPFAMLYNRCVAQSIDPTTTESASGDPAQTRPNLTDPAAAEARFLTRCPIYRSLADSTIDTSSLTTQETVAAILDLIHPKK